MKARITNDLLKRLKATGKGYDVNDTELPGFSLRVSEDGNPTSYSVRYRTTSDRRQRLKIGTPHIFTPMQARDEARKALADVTKGEDPQDVRKRLRGVQSLGAFIEDQYVPHQLAPMKSGEATLMRLKSCFGEFWHRPLSDRAFHRTILDWRARRIGSKVSNGTINRDIATLRSVFSHAVRLQLIGENPLTGIPRLKTDELASIRYLTDDEERRLMDALDAREETMRRERDSANDWRRKNGHALLPDLRAVTFVDHLKPMVLVSLNTGIRRGELFGGEWRDVDFERKTLTLRGEITKNGKTRHIPLNTIAIGVLRDWRAQTSGEGLIFKSPRSNGHFDNVYAAWDNLMTTAKISGFRWHDMRHDFASKLVMAGVDLNTVRELLGHGDIKMTLRYAHLSPKAKAEAVERIVGKANESVVPFPMVEARP